MALSIQSDLTAYFSPRKVKLYIPFSSCQRQAGITRPRKTAVGCWFHQILYKDLAN